MIKMDKEDNSADFEPIITDDGQVSNATYYEVMERQIC